jgi:hypothetical protein
MLRPGRGLALGLTIAFALCRRFAGAGGKYCNLLQGRLAACLLSAV